MSTLNTGNISGDPSFNTTGAVKLPVGSTGQRPRTPGGGSRTIVIPQLGLGRRVLEWY